MDHWFQLLKRFMIYNSILARKLLQIRDIRRPNLKHIKMFAVMPPGKIKSRLTFEIVPNSFRVGNNLFLQFFDQNNENLKVYSTHSARIQHKLPSKAL